MKQAQFFSEQLYCCGFEKQMIMVGQDAPRIDRRTVFFASSKYAGFAFGEAHGRFSDNRNMFVTRCRDDLNQFIVGIKMRRSVFRIALRASIIEYFFALFITEVPPVVHFDDSRLKAGTPSSYSR